ncbi:hypothetical protein [Methylotenera sp.]|uniref:hypothetical protein n=1 Tax=Methylotenera sp. TaxID=2051956 RepID=UPI00248906FF|nr:hypothetical protein [Methylotenera sp.]MDI1361959.1 hypothetical protein [Methylotenera sp.]
MSNPVNGAIDYFTKKKFGALITSLAPALANMSNYKNSDFPKQVAEIEEFKASLRGMPVNELLALHKQSIAEEIERTRVYAIQEEKNRFYNQHEADADFLHWSKAAYWSLDEAIALSFGKDPNKVTWKKIEPLQDKSAFAISFAKRRDLALRATRWNKFGNTIPPVIFISWAKELQIELPSELISELAKIGHTATNWREQYYKLKSEFDNLEKKAPDNTQKTENLLKAFACIAIDAYGYEPKAAKSTTTNDILKALKSHGKTLDPKTIRTWLKEGVDLLPTKPL